ncbi:MAG: hypothetical protein EOO20_21465 [Chryseobacterium sp.]|nr:MAG: hypothetical protein EOO20_21465 [Chryseobacterium sp.]
MEQTQINISKWLKITLINFLVVAIAGIVLRYKINFPMAILDQKNLLHGHSHFAFTGWVTLALMALMVGYLTKKEVKTNYKKYHLLLIFNLITAYGMLIAFIAQGYAIFSITFSTLSILVSYAFIFFFWRDLRKISDEPHIRNWFKTALILLAISSVGAFTLAYLMAANIKVQEYYFSAVYFFLHFQYNGWFLFACFGLLFFYLNIKNNDALIKLSNQLLLVMGLCVGPTYLLSILWLKLPVYVYSLASFSGIIQLLSVFYLIRLFKIIKSNHPFPRFAGSYLWFLAGVCLILKIILQALSAVPYLGSFAFGLRPVVIAYLHLCFLGIISFFIIGCIDRLFPYRQKLSRPGILIFAIGVIVQEILLMIQGIEIMTLSFVPHINILLFAAAVTIGSGLALIAFKSGSIKKPTRVKTLVG